MSDSISVDPAVLGRLGAAFAQAAARLQQSRSRLAGAVTLPSAPASSPAGADSALAEYASRLEAALSGLDGLGACTGVLATDLIRAATAYSEVDSQAMPR